MERVLIGGASASIGPILDAEPYIKVLQKVDKLEVGKIYKNDSKYGGDDLFYQCIKDKNSPIQSLDPTYFNPTPVSIKDVMTQLQIMRGGSNIVTFIEDEGIKKADNFYQSREERKLYYCIFDTDTTNPNSYEFIQCSITGLLEIMRNLVTLKPKHVGVTYGLGKDNQFDISSIMWNTYYDPNPLSRIGVRYDEKSEVITPEQISDTVRTRPIAIGVSYIDGFDGHIGIRYNESQETIAVTATEKAGSSNITVSRISKEIEIYR